MDALSHAAEAIELGLVPPEGATRQRFSSSSEHRNRGMGTEREDRSLRSTNTPPGTRRCFCRRLGPGGLIQRATSRLRSPIFSPTHRIREVMTH